MGTIRKSLGLCLGASTISLVHIEQEPEGGGRPPRIIAHSSHTHEGDAKHCLIEALQGIDIQSFDRIAATGRKFRRFVNLTSISEPEAVECAYAFVKPPGVDCPAIVSAGGETFMAYVLNRSGRITNVVTGNKCASGTGEFFLQQLRRLNVSLEEAAEWAAVEEPYHVSGRCSVFCKSDCTHATNKGTPKPQVTAGLCTMMADKILELLKKVERRDIMIAGGTAQNRMMIEYLRREIPGLVVPESASYLEALGAALWGLAHETAPFPGFADLFIAKAASFDSLPPLTDFAGQVEFKTIERDAVRVGDDCLLGLDVGSTTTKAVLVRRADCALLASVYLRTNGDPVGASRQCYHSLLEEVRRKVDPKTISIAGLGVCGSGRQIAGLHALTEGVINEIVAHAAAAVYFDPKVDTIFEIGGQDAKYTYIINSVPSDYAMNEACSAGTGSFLEESAHETLGLKMEEIAEAAFRGKRPPNFNDQCAAFIASDIKNAIHEGVAREDIAAGLVYSICMNYANRVKGNRPVGERIFMQGGVCYNGAVPLAMGSLIGKPIVVPPEPGLMGAFGVALEVRKRLEAGLIAEKTFDLEALASREVAYEKPFTCRGGKEGCDRKCSIAVIRVEGEKYPFGGACNRYYNIRKAVRCDAERLDLTRVRQRLVFQTYGAPPEKKGVRPSKGRVGLNRSFLVNTYYPLYSNFFHELGFDVVLPSRPNQEGVDLCGAPFCYPVELAHGFFHSLLENEEQMDFLFLPHFKAMPGRDEGDSLQSQVCPLVQGETFYLRTAFGKKLDRLGERGVRLLTPLLDLSGGIQDAEGPLLETAGRMGIGRRAAKEAFAVALEKQRDCLAAMKETGSQMLAGIEADPDSFGVVVFARSYNGFVEEAHMGIPHKFATRGVPVIPLDFLDLEGENSKKHMYWGSGKLILKAARFVEKHPRLFGVYITNFSCGPDSIVISYFRDIMGRKPSLTLELDSHTADAGIETRVEAFLDIVRAYRQLLAKRMIPPRQSAFSPARTVLDGRQAKVVTSAGKAIPLTDPRVTGLVPSMGKLGTEAFAAILRGCGFHAQSYRENDEAILKLGRANTSGKECLPLILTVGTLLSYVNNGKSPSEVLVYFMPTGSGPCRFGQYFVYMEDLIRRLEIPDVAMLSLSSDNSYIGLDRNFERYAWWGVVVSDVMEDIRSMLLANSADPLAAGALFDEEWRKILPALEKGSFRVLTDRLAECAERLRAIPLKRPSHSVPVIALTGEIFVRRDSLSRRYLTEYLAEKGFAAVCAPVAEWVYYCHYLAERGLNQDRLTTAQKLRLRIRNSYQKQCERRITAILAKSGLVRAEALDVAGIVENARPYISPALTGEAILTIGGALAEVVTHSCGVIAIGPFGCMPNRISEAILGEVMTAGKKLATDPQNPALRAVLAEIDDLPFLAIESDGSPFPQLISAKLETFLLRAERLHQRMTGN
ncbi:MAG: activase [Syntrophobacterales bacterium RBG_19FT_COMBO_59_10]|nr:MAG: activase [Syntrophobacterales bacterium RBG_19FT_COMBO_59_10]